MRAALLAVLVVLCAAGASGHRYPEGYPCGVCQTALEALEARPQQPLAEIASDLQASDFLATNLARGGWTMGNLSAAAVARLGGVRPACDALGFCQPQESWRDVEIDTVAAGSLDLRVTPGLGSRGYGHLRVSVISNASSAVALDLGSHFPYSAPFKYRWTDNHLSSALIPVTPGKATTVQIGSENVTVMLPAAGAGVRGIVIADPCFSGDLVGCLYSEKFQTFEHLSALLNAAMDGDDLDHWAIWGDNWYDRTGELTKRFFQQLTQKVKEKVFLSTAGNHDYWALGLPTLAAHSDQFGNGFMQYYAQDTIAAKDNSTYFLDFSVDPDKHGGEARLPNPANFNFYTQIGNLAYIGFSGAYSFDATKKYFQEACDWLASAQGVDYAFVAGHWNTDNAGCAEDMTTPSVWTELQQYSGCAALAKAGKFGFMAGHTHENRVLKSNTGIMVAGQGMEGGGNFGIPVVDTTGGYVRVWYFPVADTKGTDNYAAILKCFQENKGVSKCYHLATKWIETKI